MKVMGKLVLKHVDNLTINDWCVSDNTISVAYEPEFDEIDVTIRREGKCSLFGLTHDQAQKFVNHITMLLEKHK